MNKPLVVVTFTGYFNGASGSDLRLGEAKLDAMSWLVEQVGEVINDTLSLIFDEVKVQPVTVKVVPVGELKTIEEAVESLNKHEFQVHISAQAHIPGKGRDEGSDLMVPWEFGGDAAVLDGYGGEKMEWRRHLVDGLAFSLLSRIDQHMLGKDGVFKANISVDEGAVNVQTLKTKEGL